MYGRILFKINFEFGMDIVICLKIFIIKNLIIVSNC